MKILRYEIFQNLLFGFIMFLSRVARHEHVGIDKKIIKSDLFFITVRHRKKIPWDLFLAQKSHGILRGTKIKKTRFETTRNE